jgi:sulfate/thiosulfate transport system ATP-binding protein
MSISLEQVTKHYGGVPVVNDVSLEIGDGEFFVLLGPSGSGKSTLLRAVAGLTGVDHGRIALHGRDVTKVAARKRGVGLVFQNYALFRHMTVADNIEFALRVRRMRRRARRERRQELLRLVALEGMDDRLPAQLSGGQQQRVAVARALAHNPEVLLLDEPFGALDAKIREELRRTIREVQRELGITTVLVTHDQGEAFAMADRIGIMNLGRLLEIGAPHDLYSRPATRFVATFLGAANLFLARQVAGGIQVGAATVATAEQAPQPRGHEVVAVVRPEEIAVAANPTELGPGFVARGVVDELVFNGALEQLHLRLENGAGAPLLATADSAAIPYLEVTRTQHERRGFELHPGQSVAIGVRRVHVLPTPLSSFTACAASASETEVLARQPLLNGMAARMNTRIALRPEPQLGVPQAAPTDAAPFVGATVISCEAHPTQRAEWLLGHGASEVLVLPAQAKAPQQVMVHWTDDAVRPATLAVAASVLRHVPAEMHTEPRFGDLTYALARRPAEAPTPMLIVGVTSLVDFATRFGPLLDGGRWPVLIVRRGAAE